MPVKIPSRSLGSSDEVKRRVEAAGLAVCSRALREPAVPMFGRSPNMPPSPRTRRGPSPETVLSEGGGWVTPAFYGPGRGHRARDARCCGNAGIGRAAKQQVSLPLLDNGNDLRDTRVV